MSIVITNLQKRRVKRQWIRRAIRLLLHQEGWSKGEISIVLTDDEHIRSLNLAYRGKDEPTDVLSFSLHEGTSPTPPVDLSALEQHPLLGEVYISIPTAQRQADAAGRPLEEEVVFLAVHGVLHLLGYEDETQQGYEQMYHRGWEIVHATQAGREAV